MRALIVFGLLAGCGRSESEDLVRLCGLADRMCACRDEVCRDRVSKELEPLLPNLRVEDSEKQELELQTARFQQCMLR